MAVSATAAAAASLAYLNARYGIAKDLVNVATVYSTLSKIQKFEKQDRLNLFYLIEENAQNTRFADKIFIKFEGRTITFKQFYDLALHYAGWLHSTHKVTRGDVVALDFMNGPELLILTVAVWSLGALPALVNYNLSGRSLEHCLRTASARLFIVETEVADRVLTAETQEKLASSTFRNNAFPMDMVVLSQSLQTSLEHYKQYRAPDSARSGVVGNSPAVLMATSGTTGLPKQAVVAWPRLWGAPSILAAYCKIQSVAARKPDTWYTAMPLYHGTAFMGAFSLAAVAACSLAIGRRFSVSSFWPDVRRHQATCILYVGEALRYLLAAPPQSEGDMSHSVRLAFGNGLRPDVWTKFKTRFGIETIVEFYGATEGTFAVFNVSRNSLTEGAVGSGGKLSTWLQSRTLAIVKLDWAREEPWRDPETGFCVKVPTGQPGEMIAKLDPNDLRSSFVGYYNNDKATKEKVLHDVFVKGDTYFRSGDVLRRDAEGRIWFSDRIGDTFRWKSENVSTMEVGEVVGHHPDVQEANVYGVNVPGHEGRAGCAALVLKESAFEDSANIKPDVLRSLATHSRNSLQKYSVPVFLRVVKELVTTGNNKTLKHALRNQGVDPQALQDAGSGDLIYWLQPGAESYVKFEADDWTVLNAGKVRL